MTGQGATTSVCDADGTVQDRKGDDEQVDASIEKVWTAAQQGRDGALARLLPHASEAARKAAAVVAAENDRVACLALLVDAHVCLHARTYQRWPEDTPRTLLSVATARGSCAAVAFVLQTTRPAPSPRELLAAAETAITHQQHCTVLRLLVQAKADVQALVRTALEDERAGECTDAVRTLVSLGASVGHAGYLRMAVRTLNVEAVQMILAAGVDVNQPIKLGTCRARRRVACTSPVYAACALYSTELLFVLLRAKADVDAVDDASAKTPLFAAIQVSSKSVSKRMVRMLLRAKADVNKRAGLHERTPLCMVAGRMLRSAKRAAGTNGRAGFCGRDDEYGICGVLVRAKANVDARDVSGFTPVLRAALHGSTNTLLLLLDHGADVDLCVPANGWNPLHAAAYGGHRGAWQILAKHAPHLQNGVTTVDWDDVPAGTRPADLARNYDTLSLRHPRSALEHLGARIQYLESLLLGDERTEFNRMFSLTNATNYRRAWMMAF